MTMETPKKTRNVKKPTPYEMIFLMHLFDAVAALKDKNDTTVTKMAGECDIELPNLCRYKRETPNARILSALRLVKPMGHSLGELITDAERAADEWQRQEDEKKKKK